MLEAIKHTADFLREKTNFNPEIGIILGTGLEGLVNEIILFKQLPMRKFQTFQYPQWKGIEVNLFLGNLVKKRSGYAG